jgi:hypothetical protein
LLETPGRAWREDASDKLVQLSNQIEDRSLLPILSLGGHHASSTTCSTGAGNACEYVHNGTAGNPFIYYVTVWNPWNAGTNETYRLLINGTVVAGGRGNTAVVIASGLAADGLPSISWINCHRKRKPPLSMTRVAGPHSGRQIPSSRTPNCVKWWNWDQYEGAVA